MDGIVFFIQLLSNLTSFAISIGIYLLTALGLHAIARRRGISKPWLAFIPVAQLWTLGCIGDQYRYVTKNQVKSRRKVLLWLEVIMAIIAIALVVFMVLFMLSALMPLPYSSGFYAGRVEPDIQAAMPYLPGVLICLLVYLAVSIVYLVFYYIALYDVYASCSPEYKVLFIVLSILFNITIPFFIFFNRNSDLGMPPRRDAIPPQHQQPQYQAQYQQAQYQAPQYQQPRENEPWQQPRENEPWQQPRENEPWQQES